MRRTFFIISAVLLLAGGAPVFGQEASLAEKRFKINKLESEPTIDGDIDEAEWAGAARVSDLHEVQPLEFTDPSERTVWYVGYDSKALYVAARAFDSNPDAIVARTLRQGGSLNSDDSLHILIDAFNNKRSGYTFALNPNGVRYDAIFTNGTQESDDWEGIWRGAAERTTDGWAMEMAIPFNTVTFDPANGTWGINLWREVPRRNEKIAWQSRNGEINPTVSGEAFGFDNLSQGIGLDIIPSASMTYDDDRVLNVSESEFNPSLDISYKLTPSINALLTINTDFAATEVDGRQLNLQRFSLFFPEKRSFFLTDFDIFQFGGVSTGNNFRERLIGVRSGNNGLAFFSRRIGLSQDNDPVDIVAGAKFSGRIGEFDFGTLLIRQDEFQGIDATDLLVTRVSRGVFEESSVGAIYTNGDPASNSDSSLAGVDFIYRNTRLTNNRTLEAHMWAQKSDNDGIEDNDLAWSAAVGFPTKEGWEGGLQIQEVEENFDPALGFANRTGVRLYGGELAFRRILTGKNWIRELYHQIEASRWEFLDTGRVQSQELQFNVLNMRSNQGDFMRIDYSLQKEGLLPGEQPLDDLGIIIPAGEYSFERYGSFIRTASYRKFSFQLRIDDGGWFNGDRFQLRPEIEWTPNEHLRFKLEYDWNRFDFPGVSAITRQISLENEIAFNSKLALVTLAQFDNISDDLGINTRLRYNVAAGKDLWFVLNHNMQRDPIDDRFHSTESVAAVKVRYTFRY